MQLSVIFILVKALDKAADICGVAFIIDDVLEEFKEGDHLAEYGHLFPEDLTNVFYYVEGNTGRKSTGFALVAEEQN